MFLNEEFLKVWEELNGLNEWTDSLNRKRTATEVGVLYSLEGQELCDGCGRVVEQPYDKFDKPYNLVNGHKLCSDCLAGWINHPIGFIDKVIYIGTKDYNNNDVLLKLNQQEVDEIITKWNQLKTAGKLNKLSPPRIKEVEDLFIETIEQLNLNASAMED